MRSELWESADYAVRLLATATCLAVLLCQWMGVDVESNPVEAGVLMAVGWTLCGLALRLDERLGDWYESQSFSEDDKGDDV